MRAALDRARVHTEATLSGHKLGHRREAAVSEPEPAGEKMARPEGLEPPTYWFVASRSIHLSYGRALPAAID